MRPAGAFASPGRQPAVPPNDLCLFLREEVVVTIRTRDLCKRTFTRGPVIGDVRAKGLRLRRHGLDAVHGRAERERRAQHIHHALARARQIQRAGTPAVRRRTLSSDSGFWCASISRKFSKSSPTTATRNCPASAA